MNRRYRTIAVLIIAVAMAGVASYGVYRTVQKMPVKQVEVANYKVVVAAHAMRMGTRLTDRDLKVVAWPNSSPVPQSHSEIKELVDRGLLSSVVENEPLTESKLAPIQAGAGLSPTIPQGMRAMSVKVNEVVSGSAARNAAVPTVLLLASGLLFRKWSATSAQGASLPQTHAYQLLRATVAKRPARRPLRKSASSQISGAETRTFRASAQRVLVWRQGAGCVP